MSQASEILKRLREYSTKDHDTITLKFRDPDGQLVKLLQAIKAASDPGHSFVVVVDPDEGGGEKFSIDGDGGFSLREIK